MEAFEVCSKCQYYSRFDSQILPMSDELPLFSTPINGVFFHPRDYQARAIDAVRKAWETSQATILELPTGAGKTTVAAELIKSNPSGRSLFLCHRQKLVHQAAERLTQYGVDTAIEMGSLQAGDSLTEQKRCVVASVQSLISGNEIKRMENLRGSFTMMVCDECHVSVSKSWLSTIKFFRDKNPGMKIVGLSATPKRSDGKALSQVFDSVALQIPLIDLIDQGWLVDLEPYTVKIASLNLEKVSVVNGDFAEGDLLQVLLQNKNLYGVAEGIWQHCRDKKSIVFTCRVEHAEALAVILNGTGYEPGCAAAISANTPSGERVKLFDGFKKRKFRYLINVDIAGIGYDEPTVEAIISAAPTLSRNRYAQQIGRGTRPLPGVVDNLPDSIARKSAINASAKPKLRILDFCGNASRHSLIGPADILGGTFSDEARARVNELAREGKVKNLKQSLELAEAIIRQRLEESKRQRDSIYGSVKGRAQTQLHYFDPWEEVKRNREKWSGYQRHRILSLKEKALLRKLGHDPEHLTFDQGESILRQNRQISSGQRRVLLRAGYNDDELMDVPKWTASKMIEACKNNNWRRPNVPGH